MKGALLKALELAELLFNEQQKSIITKIVDEVEINSRALDYELLLSLDQSLGGIGGYCMPINPVLNPFPGGVARSLFRPVTK